MADEELGFEESPEEQEINKSEKRIKDLSEKVKTTAQERDELATAKAEAETKATEAQKEVEFYKDFSQQTSKYKDAAEYQDQIKEKVLAGYSVEDATISVLAKEGKFTPPIPEAPKGESPAGGSATNTITDTNKTIGDMDQTERRDILAKNLDLA